MIIHPTSPPTHGYHPAVAPEFCSQLCAPAAAAEQPDLAATQTYLPSWAWSNFLFYMEQKWDLERERRGLLWLETELSLLTLKTISGKHLGRCLSSGNWQTPHGIMRDCVGEKWSSQALGQAELVWILCLSVISGVIVGNQLHFPEPHFLPL